MRLGIVPLEGLLAERDALVKQVAPLRAKFGSFGTWDALRKIELAKLAAVKRAEATVSGKKLSNDEVSDQCHADGRYIDFITESTRQRGEWTILEGRIEGIADTINRGQAVARFLSQEAGLSR